MTVRLKHPETIGGARHESAGAEAGQARPVYLDNAATTRVDPVVLDAMFSILSDDMIGNAHARHHVHGASALRIVEKARRQVADAIGCDKSQIVFTSGATESNNLILKGLASYLISRGKTHIITSAVEHKSVLAPLQYLEGMGFSLTVLPVKPCAMIEADTIERAITEKTGLVSIQAVNNETGTIQPLCEISILLRCRGILFHTDAAQALGKMEFSVHEAGVDFASLSSHKAHGPQGVGAVFARDAALLESTTHGGGQESGLRPGTIPVALCAGFGVASSILKTERSRLQRLRQGFLDKLSDLAPVVNGHSDPTWNVPGILNLRFAGIDSDTLVMELPQLAFAQGSACGGTGERVSHVIKAMTGSDEAARESIRISFGRFSTEEDLDLAAKQIIDCVRQIRELQGVIK